MKIRNYTELEVYQMAFNAAIEIFKLTKSFPKEEKYSLIDQIRRSSRSVCANIAEAFERRHYPKSFILRLNDAQAETAETRVWLSFCLKCNYINEENYKSLYKTYEYIIGKLITMMNQPEKWSI